jgi:hypothetical protein
LEFSIFSTLNREISVKLKTQPEQLDSWHPVAAPTITEISFFRLSLARQGNDAREEIFLPSSLSWRWRLEALPHTSLCSSPDIPRAINQEISLCCGKNRRMCDRICDFSSVSRRVFLLLLPSHLSKQM